jgi:molybdopterin converting factor small subunit
MDKKSVVLMFFGNLARQAGPEKQVLEVDGDFAKGVDSVRRKIDELIGRKVLYAVAYNGVSLSAVSPAPTAIQDGDLFQVFPVVIGG